MTDAETPQTAKPEPETVAVEDLLPYLKAGKKIIAADAIQDSRSHTILQKGQEFFSPNQLYGMMNRGIEKARILHSDGIVLVEFISPPAESGKPHKFYQGVTDVKEPMKFLIKHATGIPHAQMLEKPVIDDLIDDSIAFLAQKGLAYKAHEKPFFDEYRNGDGKDCRQDYRAEYREAVGTTLLAVARGNDIPETSSKDKMSFNADKEQIALGTFMAPLAKHKARELKAQEPLKYAHRDAAQLGRDLLWQRGFNDTVCLIVRCLGKDYAPEEFSKKDIRIRLPYEARSDYRQLFGGQ